jgi:hypothetical protein
MTGTAITPAEFDQLLAGAQVSLLRWEAQPEYAVTVEGPDLELFAAGHPRPPEQLEWWWPWLEQITRLIHGGGAVERVAVVDDPATLYQRWRQWAAGPARQAGEVIQWMSADRARALGLDRGQDWWLIDGTKVIVMEFASTREMTSMTIITDPGAVARYQARWDLATRNATTAERSAAA